MILLNLVIVSTPEDKEYLKELNKYLAQLKREYENVQFWDESQMMSGTNIN